MDFSYDEAKAVISDKSNVHHARYHNNDPDIHGAVTRAYLKQYPGEVDLSNSTPEVLRQAAEKAGGPEAASTVEEDAAREQTMNELRGRWGAEFETKFEHARVGLQYVEAAAPGLLEDVVGGELGNHPAILEAAAVIGEGLSRR